MLICLNEIQTNVYFRKKKERERIVANVYRRNATLLVNIVWLFCNFMKDQNQL